MIEDKYYEECLAEIKALLPDDQKKKVLYQDYCEYDRDFLGFLDVYRPLADLIPKDKIVIDFGCYLAAQAYYFKDHKKYIGVDVLDMYRFTPPNAEHYIGSIQDYIKKEFHPKGRLDNLDYFAICSYVPDDDAMELVSRTFINAYIYYPNGSHNRI